MLAMVLLGALLASIIAALSLSLLFHFTPELAVQGCPLSGIFGALIGVFVGLFMSNVNPPQYDWFGFYPMGQLVFCTIGGALGAAPARRFAVKRAQPATVDGGADAGAAVLPTLEPVRFEAELPQPLRLRSILPIVLTLSVILGAIGVYSYLNPRRLPVVAVPAVTDAVVVPTRIKEGMTMDEVRAQVGAPTLIGRDELYSTWFYAVRRGSWSREGSELAPLLQITIDANDHVSGWQFVHPRSGAVLTQSESTLQATRWLNALCGFGDGPRIALKDTLIPGVTTTEAVLSSFGAPGMQPWVNALRREIFVRAQPDGTHVLTYPVDHPSPMYTPVMFIEVRFDAADRVRVWSFGGSC